MHSSEVSLRTFLIILLSGDVGHEQVVCLERLEKDFQ